MKLKDLAVGKSGDVRIQLLRYFVSGGVAFLVDAGLLTLLTECFGQERLLVWTAIAFLVGLGVTYLFSIAWDNRSVKNKGVEAGIFVLIGVVGFFLTELFMWLFATKLDLHYLLSKVITTVLVFIWNFVAKKTILFKSK